MADRRLEKDSIGSLEVPSTALYGAQTQRAVNNFTISKDPMPWCFIETVLQLKYCAAKANEELGLLSKDISSSICEAVDKLLIEKPADQFPVPIFQTGSGTSTNMNVNEVIAGAVKQTGTTISPNDHVNLGQSSNDVIPTAMHISTGQVIDRQLLPSFIELAREIRKFADKHKAVIKTGRTHLMDALPVRLFDEFEAWALQIDESGERLSEAQKRLFKVPLGGTAVGNGVNCHPKFAQKVFRHLHDRTELRFHSHSSSFKGQSSLDTVVEISGHLKTAAVVISKISNDLRWMNSGPLAGLGEIRLPALQPGSSIMPAKINPIIPEAVLMAMAQVIGNDTTIVLCGTGGSFQLNTMLPLAAAKLLESVFLLSGSCQSLAIDAIRGIEVNTETFNKVLPLNPILVTSLNPLIGYIKAAELGKIAQKEQRPILDVALEHTNIEKGTLEKLLDPALLADGGLKDST